MKIIYCGIRAENYDPRRKPSFEYDNFYLTLKNIPGLEVVEFPYDAIIGTGKKEFNGRLLELVKKEKPDLLFVLFILVAFGAFIEAYTGGGRRWLLVCAASLALAVPPSSSGRRLPAIMIMSLTPAPARPEL